MKEMDELSAGIEKLKRNSDSQRRVIEALEKDRAFLMERTRFLGQKLSEAYVIYEEAGKRILDFVDKETAPIKNQIAELKAETKKLPDMEHELGVHSSHLSKIRLTDQALKTKLAEAEKTLRKLNEMEASLKAYTQRMKESETREGQAVDQRISEMKGHLESRVKASEDRFSLKIEESSEEVLQDATDSINALAASQHELKKRLGETALAVRALKSNSDSFRKYIHSAGLSRGGMEKKLSASQASIRELESSISLIQKKLGNIGLEDEKLENRLSGLKKSAGQIIDSRMEQEKSHIESRFKRQDALLEQRVRILSGEIDRKALAISGKVLLERKHADEMKAWLERRIKEFQKAEHINQNRLEREIASARKDFRLQGSGLLSRMDKQAAGFSASLREQAAGYDSARKEIGKRLSLHQAVMKGMESSIAGLARRLDSEGLEDEKLEKRLLDVKKAAQEFADSRIEQLKERNESNHKRLAELLDSKNKALSESFDARFSRMNERFDGVKLDEGKLEKRLMDVRKSAEEVVDSKAAQFRSQMDSSNKKHLELIDYRIGRFSEGFDAKLSRINKRMDSVNLEDEKLEKRLLDVKKAAQEFADSRIEQLKERNESNHKNLTGMIDSKNKALSESFDAKLSKVSERLDSARLDENKLEKRLLDARKSAEEIVDSLAGQIKSRMDSAAKRQAETLDSRVAKLSEGFDAKLSRVNQKMDSINLEDEKLERRLSSLRAGLEESMSSGLGGMKSYSDAGQKKQAGLAISGMKAIADELEGKISRLNERLLSEKRDMESIESMVDRKMDGIQKGLSSKVSSLDAQTEKRILQVYSHVSSEKKALAELKSGLEREIREQQKSLSARVGGLAEKTESRLARLSQDISLERKALADEKAGFSEKVASVNQAMSRLNEFSRSTDSRLKEFSKLYLDKLQESQFRYAESVKELSQRLKSLEMAGKVSSSQSSGLNKQLSVLESSKISTEKRLTEADSRLNRLESSVPSLDSSSKTAFMELKKQVDFLTSRNSSLGEQLAKTNQAVQQMLGAGKFSEQKIRNVSSDQEDKEKRIREVENAIRMLSERLSKQNILTMNSEMESLRKEIAGWKSEQSKLYDMLKED